MSLVKNVCETLGKYYQQNSIEYNGYLSNHCEENGFESDEFREEMGQDPDENQILLFASDVPFPYPEDKKQEWEDNIDDIDRLKHIFNIIKMCWDKPDAFSGILPLLKFDKDFYDVDDERMNDIEEMYKTQCPVLWNSGMKTERGFLRLLAVGNKHDIDYIGYLVDDYSRNRIQHFDKGSLSVMKWSTYSPHFIQLKSNGVLMKGIEVQDNNKVDSNGNPIMIKVNKPCIEILRHGVISFGKRFTPKLLLVGMTKINHLLSDIVTYINSGISLIRNIMANAKKHQKGAAPFQIDLCFATGKPKRVEITDEGLDDVKQEDDDPDDEIDHTEDDEKRNVYKDWIGDIKNKLDKNKLKYQSGIVEDIDDSMRVFNRLYDEHAKNNSNENDYPQRKRFIFMVDKRKKDKDRVYLYDPPSGKLTRDMPNNCVSHWELSASRTCLLPNTKYDENEAIKQDPDKDTKEDTNKDISDVNIGCNDHCKGGLLTISFHVKSEDEIKMYLYFQGQRIRFLPEDIKTVLPKLFIGSEENKSYIKDVNKELDGLINEMNKKIIDRKFTSFCQSYLTKKN